MVEHRVMRESREEFRCIQLPSQQRLHLHAHPRVHQLIGIYSVHEVRCMQRAGICPLCVFVGRVFVFPAQKFSRDLAAVPPVLIHRPIDAVSL